MDISDAKAAARVLRTELTSRGIDLSHSAALELVARQLGHRDWNTAAASLQRPEHHGQMGNPVPVLRVHDSDLARQFYTDALGFTLLWEHRFEPGLPSYARVERDQAQLDLSEHFGDGTPGTVVWFSVRDVAQLHLELRPRLNPSQRPDVDWDAPGGPTLPVLDPFGNILRFCQTT